MAVDRSGQEDIQDIAVWLSDITLQMWSVMTEIVVFYWCHTYEAAVLICLILFTAVPKLFRLSL